MKETKNKTPKNKSKIKIIAITAGVIVLIAGAIFFIKKRNKPAQEELPKIENVSSTNKQNTNNSDNKNQDNNAAVDNSYKPESDNNKDITGKESDEAIVAKIAVAVGDMIDDSVIAYDYWTPDYNQPTLNSILGKNVKAEFNFNRDIFANKLITGSSNEASVPIIKNLTTMNVNKDTKSKMDKLNIQKLSNNQYEASLTLAKSITDNDYGYDPNDLTSTAKQILDEYEEEGTLNEHSDVEKEKLIIEKVDKNKWKVKFARDDWFLVKGEN